MLSARAGIGVLRLRVESGTLQLFKLSKIGESKDFAESHLRSVRKFSWHLALPAVGRAREGRGRDAG